MTREPLMNWDQKRCPNCGTLDDRVHPWWCSNHPDFAHADEHKVRKTGIKNDQQRPTSTYNSPMNAKQQKEKRSPDNDLQNTDNRIGKGEVESSILSGSTSETPSKTIT
jgi:hypothetical protein